MYYVFPSLRGTFASHCVSFQTLLGRWAYLFSCRMWCCLAKIAWLYVRIVGKVDGYSEV
jgi:hypothetical protein